MKILLIYLLAVNLAGYLAMGADKKRARENRWRIPERTLLLLAAAGGSAGVAMGMLSFRHKTRHWKFILGVPAILLIQAALLLWGATRMVP